MAGKKYWDVMYTLCSSTSLQMPNIELHRPGIEPGPPDRMWTLYHWAMESVYNMGVLTSQYFSPNAKYWTASSQNRTRAPPDRMWTLYHWAMESIHYMGVLVSWARGRGQILCNYSTPPTHQQASMYTYTMEGEGEPCQPAPSPWVPAHTTQLQGDLRTPLTHNNTQQHTRTPNNRQQHTTTIHNSTRVPMSRSFLNCC